MSLFARLLTIHVLVAVPATVVLIASADRIGVGVIAAAVIAIAAVAVGLSALAARSMARSLDQIASEVTRVATGEFTRVEPTGPAEARTLARAVNEMASDLAARVEQLRAETSLREHVLSAMDEGVILAEDDRVVYANPSAHRLFGSEEMKTLPPQVPRPEGARPATQTFTLHHPVTRELRCSATRVAGGAVLVVVQDVTESERIDRVRRDFVANASHEMKTPVAGILATAETLRDAIHDDPESAKRFAATLAKEATRLATLIQDLLDLARLDRPEAPGTDVDLSKVVLEEVEHAFAQARAQQVGIAGDIADGLVVSGRAEDLAALPRNLLDNAIRYTRGHGNVTVTLRAEDGDAVLTVADTGSGIPAKDLPRIFERFYRVDQARARETGGTGLGLAIVRHVAESHGGRVHATSELGRGSTFVVRLPLAR